MADKNLLEILEHINPVTCTYQEWINVGMALKQEGYSADDWDLWSRSDSRYHDGECHAKWNSFNGSNTPVTAGTIYQMAKERGYIPISDSFREYDWNDEILNEENTSFCNSGEGVLIHEPSDWNPVKEIVTYLETLFEANENVGYVTETWDKTDEKGTKYLPTKGACDRTAGELIELLNKCNGDIGAVIGDCNEKAGAWIRFNPLDGKGVKNENVTDFRYALVESDCMPIEQQNALMRELELPIAVLVYSGGKSIHAVVKVDAPNYEEYRKRVDYLYKICRKNGFDIDTQNKNPSRLSRLPGVVRNGKKQFIIDTNIGKENFTEWRDWIESINDELPDPEKLSEIWDNLPELAPPLIDGVLRQGHKMLIAGPSKAGKSYALIEMCVAIAEGTKWLGFNCAQGKVMYVNLELDRPSCLHRFKDVYKAMGIAPKNLDNIDIWNLRGHSVPMDKLAPKLIRRASKKDFIAIIIDPIYKVITGDENSADQMANFCNQFDKVCTELGCAVIYCHHHSKGGQGGKKSMDRASGSGVFARDPDALIDLVELEVKETLYKQQTDTAVCEVVHDWLKRFNKEMYCSQDDLLTPKKMLEIANENLLRKSFELMMEDVEKVRNSTQNKTAWRVEGTLREFPKFKPMNLWFDYPVHREDKDGVLADCSIEGDNAGWKNNFSKKKTNQERSQERKESIETAFSGVEENGKCRISDLAEYLAITEKTVRSRLKEHGDFWVEGGECGLKGKGKSR